MAQTDAWHWLAEFTDGSQLAECDADGDHGFAEIQQDRMARFILIPQRDDLSHHVVEPRHGQPVTFVRRRTKTLSPITGEEVAAETTLHVLGIGGVYTFIAENGATALSDDFNLL